MKNLLKLGLVACGLVLSTVATTSNVSAKGAEEESIAPEAGRCVGSGHCGQTVNGTLLYGKWQE